MVSVNLQPRREIERPMREADGCVDARLRVLYVNHSMRVGGIETMIRDFARQIDQTKFEPSVGVFDAGGVLEADLARAGVPVFDLAKHEGMDLGLVKRMRRLLRQQHIRVVHSHNYSAWMYCVLASVGLSGLTLVHTEHSRVQPLLRRRLLERALAARTDAVIAVSEDVKRCLVEDIGIARDDVTVIANGVDTKRYRPDETHRASMRTQLGADDGTTVFGIVARLVPVKSHSTLLDAFARVMQANRRCKLVIAGDGPCRAALEEQADRLAIGKQVAFLGEVADAERVLNGLDVYVLSSVDEGMNLTLLEAMATQLPVVATAVGGNPEVVEHGISGFVVPALRPDLMAEQMLVLATQTELRRSMAAASLARAVTRYSQRRTISSYERLYLGARAAATSGAQ